VLSAPTGFGKTAVAAFVIAARKINTLILVHRRQLLDQWRERLAMFLELPPDSIGQVGGGKSAPTGIVDVAVVQSLYVKKQVNDVVGNYGQLIVDECHHVSAFSFEQVMRQAKAQFVLGMTATPTRKDGHHPIITMQCGPIRFCLSARSMAETSPFQHRVISVLTDFALPDSSSSPKIHEVYAALIEDDKRNQRVVSDLIAAVEAGRSPLLLTSRTAHVETFRNVCENGAAKLDHRAAE
jgi:superfamily II DNA or RNA helicase